MSEAYMAPPRAEEDLQDLKEHLLIESNVLLPVHLIAPPGSEEVRLANAQDEKDDVSDTSFREEINPVYTAFE